MSLRLLPTIPTDALQLRKLVPDANAVRSILLPGAKPQDSDAATAPTPHYNTSILQVSCSSGCPVL